jgi:methyl-accepting chemotaxis protein
LPSYSFALERVEPIAFARRSAEAAKGIEALIIASRRQVILVRSLVLRRGNAVSRIDGEIADINASVTSNLRERGRTSEWPGTRTIKTAINQLDQRSQKNTAMARRQSPIRRAETEVFEQLNRPIPNCREGTGLDSIG